MSNGRERRCNCKWNYRERCAQDGEIVATFAIEHSGIAYAHHQLHQNAEANYVSVSNHVAQDGKNLVPGKRPRFAFSNRGNVFPLMC